MGKKSKRARAKQEDGQKAPSLRLAKLDEKVEEETKDNLRFDDPFVEEIEEDIVPGEEGDDAWEDVEEGGGGGGGDYEVVQSWNPLTGERLKPGQQLEMDPSAYKMHHALTAEWPSLSFDFLRDDLGDHRTRFPHCLTVVTGSQADKAGNNQLTVMRLSDLARMERENEDDILGDEYDGPDKEDDSDDDSDEEDVDLDPIVEHYSIKHHGGVNRVRCMPQQPNIVASWSDVGKVYLFNVESILQRFAASSGKVTHQLDIPQKPFFNYGKHRSEGYALDWSRVKQGHMVSGDCEGNIHVWTPQDASYAVSPLYQANEKTKNSGSMSSVEDLQWSPTEATVFASAECGGYIRIFDIRAPGRSMLNHQVHNNNNNNSNQNDGKSTAADVNVLSWNALVTNLLATGGDDGALSVWDLRTFSSSSNVVEPLARFTAHPSPISSVEWHPTDESMLAVTDDAGAYVYDLSVEEDDAVGNNQLKDIPPQLLFVHSGSEQFKEVHWHPQISSCLMTTALSGYSIFIPANL